MVSLANNYTAGWTRVAMGTTGLIVGPWALQDNASYRWLFGCYLIVALFVQVLIKRDVGGSWRALTMGVIDLAMVTFFVHQVGSASTMLVSAYFVIGVINALVVNRRVALSLAALGILFYSGVLVLESLSVLPYAPSGVVLGSVKPAPRGMAVAAILVSVLLLASTIVVSQLAESLRRRERELLAANAQLEELSLRDALTQLYNRRHLMARLGDELRRVRRGAQLTLLMVDLDGFKKVNDDHGHLAGDTVLTAISTALDDATRSTDVLGRYGGDEFVILLIDTDLDHSHRVAKRLVGAVRRASEKVDVDCIVTASVGIAVARRDDGPRELIRRADEASYGAKIAGGDRAVADPSAT